MGIVTLATFTCQPREAVIGRRQENQWLGELQRGTGPLQNPLFLANVTMPPCLVRSELARFSLTRLLVVAAQRERMPAADRANPSNIAGRRLPCAQTGHHSEMKPAT